MPDLNREVERWFLELRDPISRYLRSLGCREPLTDDIAQETFLRLHRGLLVGLQIGDVRAWVFRVAQNLWIDTRRERQHYWTTAWAEKDRPDLTPIDSAPDPEQQALQRQRLRLIGQELSRLPKLQRECVRLRSQGLHYHEIAATLDIPMTAAVDYVRRAVKRVRRRLRD